MGFWKVTVCAAVAWSAGISGISAQQLSPQQIQTIKDTAASICNTVKEAKGQKNDVQIQGDVNAELGGLLGKVANVGGSGKGALTREEFEGLSGRPPPSLCRVTAIVANGYSTRCSTGLVLPQNQAPIGLLLPRWPEKYSRLLRGIA